MSDLYAVVVYYLFLFVAFALIGLAIIAAILELFF